MAATDFIQKWRNALNYLGKPMIGIHVNWEIIPVDSKVESFFGEEAWGKIYNCIPPWFKTPQTFKRLIDANNSEYLQIVREETENGKIEYYRKNGLTDTSFCAFGSHNSSFVLLGDGNHRFLDCVYLIDVEKLSFAPEIEKTSVDIIYLNNFDQVIEPIKIWPTWK